MTVALSVVSSPDVHVINVAIDLIRADQRAQPRDHLNTKITNEYAQEMRGGVSFPPMIVFHDGDVYWLADGFHRHYAAQGAGLKSFRCEVRSGGLREAILFSCGANAAHGYRRTNEDKRRAARRMLEDEQWRQWSDREIARRCAVGHKMVGELRAMMQPEITVTGSSPSENSPRTYTTKHGTTTTMDTGAIGKRKGAGSRIKVPEGELLSDMIRRGLALEADGANVKAVAKKLGLDIRAYRQARDIILLGDRNDLGQADTTLVSAAMVELDESQRAKGAHKTIQHIVNRIWGARGGRTNGSEANRLDAFEGALVILVETCESASEINIPHLNREQATSAIKQLKLADAGLRALRSRIEETQK